MAEDLVIRIAISICHGYREIKDADFAQATKEASIGAKLDTGGQISNR